MLLSSLISILYPRNWVIELLESGVRIIRSKKIIILEENLGVRIIRGSELIEEIRYMLLANFKPKRTAAASRAFLATARLSCCKRFSVKHFKNILEVVTCKIKHLSIFITFLKMFYFTCNHGFSVASVAYSSNLFC